MKKWSWRHCLIGCLVIILVAIILLTLLIYISFFMLKTALNRVLTERLHIPFYSFLQDFQRSMTDFIKNFSASWMGLVRQPSICPNCM